VNACGLYI